jgi:Ca2+-binding RTX toxin-like protein
MSEENVEVVRRALFLSGPHDLLRGTAGPDVIVGGLGEDQITAGGGKDVVCAGGGKDRLLALPPFRGDPASHLTQPSTALRIDGARRHRGEPPGARHRDPKEDPG